MKRHVRLLLAAAALSLSVTASAQCPWPPSTGSETFSAVIPGGTFSTGLALSVHNFSLTPVKYGLTIGQWGLPVATNCGGQIFTTTDACRTFGTLLRELFPRGGGDEAA